MISLLAIVDGIGVLGYLFAALWSFDNYHRTSGLSNYWLMFCAASVLGFLWATTGVLMFLNVNVAMLDLLRSLFLITMASVFGTAGLVTYYSSVNRKVR